MIPLASIVLGGSRVETKRGPAFRPCAPNGVFPRLGDKWTILTLSMLALAPGHRLRFSAMKNGIEGITQRMLTVTLRNLERDGFLHRHYFAEVPPRVEYELSEMGTSILPALEELTFWIKAHWPRIEEARRTYDSANG